MEEQIIESVNKICRYLAHRHVGTLSPASMRDYWGSESADVIMVLGSDLPQVAEAGCGAYLAGLGRYLLFCGGKGHSTENLKRKAGRILQRDISTLPGTEAELYACLARERYHVPDQAILLEKHSSNTMENIRFGKDVLEYNHVPCRTVLLMQDPLLQRRSYVTALEILGNNSKLLSYAPFIPAYESANAALTDDSLWEKGRFMELLMGEIWRLRDDEHGYGPKGAGFFGHVDIPEEIEEAYSILLQAVPEYAGRCR